MTWSTDTIAHGNQQNKRAHSFRKSFMTCRPSKRHHIALRKKSKARTRDFLQRIYTLRSNSSFTVDKSASEDEDVEIGTDQGSYERNSCERRSPFKNKKKNLSSPCGSVTSPKIMHHQVGRSSEPSEVLPSSGDFTDTLHIHSANAEDEDEEIGTHKCTIVRNSWGRTPFKNKKRILSSPCSSESRPEIVHIAKSSALSEALPFGEDLTNPPHIHSADANLKRVNQESLNSIFMDGCINETNSLQSEATISDLGYNLGSKCGDDSSAIGSEPCVLEADTRKGISTVSNSTVHEVPGPVPEVYILEEKTTIISQTQPNCRSSFSERDSKEGNTRYQVARYLEKKCSTTQQHSRRRNIGYSKKASVIGFDVSGTLDTGVAHPSFSGIYVNVEVLDGTRKSKGISSSQCDILPQDSTIIDLSKIRKATICSDTDTSSSSEVSSVSGNINMTRQHLCHTNNSSPPLHTCRRHHRDRPIRAQIFRRPRKILVLGDMMSGKSNLISAYCNDKFKEDYIPTIVRCLQTDAEVFGERINLVVVEISGRDDFQPLRRYAYHKMDAAIICYSVDSIGSLERVSNYWVPELRKHAPKAPFVVVGTKRDIRDAARDRVEEHKQKLRGESQDVEMAGRLAAEAAFVKEFVSHDRGKRVSDDLGAAAFYECCSIYRDGTRKVFEGVAKVALQKSRRKRKMSSRHVDSMCTIL